MSMSVSMLPPAPWKSLVGCHYSGSQQVTGVKEREGRGGDSDGGREGGGVVILGEVLNRSTVLWRFFCVFASKSTVPV